MKQLQHQVTAKAAQQGPPTIGREQAQSVKATGAQNNHFGEHITAALVV